MTSNNEMPDAIQRLNDRINEDGSLSTSDVNQFIADIKILKKLKADSQAPVDVEYLKDGIRNAIAETHDIDVTDDHYADAVIELLKSDGILRTPPTDTAEVLGALDNITESYRCSLRGYQLSDFDKSIKTIRAYIERQG